MSVEDYKRVPNILKHCTVAIAAKIPGSPEQKYANAFRIARAHLTKYGYLTAGSHEGDVAAIGITNKRAGRAVKHSLEGLAKTATFDRMAEAIMRADETRQLHGDVPLPRSNDESEKSFAESIRRLLKFRPFRWDKKTTPPVGSKEATKKPNRDGKAKRTKRAPHPRVKRARRK